jgi:signal transduction histidine kinase
MSALRLAALSVVYLAAAIALTLGFATLLPGIPPADLPAIAMLLLMAGLGSLLAVVLLRLAMGSHLVGVRVQLVGASLLGCVLLVGLLMLGTEEMLISQHDHDVVLVLLLFAGLIAIGISLSWATPLARRIERVRAGTAQLAAGELHTTLPVDGRDEIALLAADFNRMAAALQGAAAHERELEHARRDLIAAVSHDLRTPLAAVRALIEALADDVVEDAETRSRYLRSAQREIAHLGQLVDDLFELAQIDAGVLRLQLERASLHDLISDTVSSFQPQALQQGVRLVGDVQGEIDPVLINPPKLQRVLHNLLSNALRHTPADGMVLLRAQPDGNHVLVEVADSGEGIAPDDLPHVFERSYRGDPARTRGGMERSAGAGLGLAIARGLIEAHGGSIGVQSQPGQGARFYFTLRRA